MPSTKVEVVAYCSFENSNIDEVYTCLSITTLTYLYFFFATRKQGNGRKETITNIRAKLINPISCRYRSADKAINANPVMTMLFPIYFPNPSGLDSFVRSTPFIQ